VRVLFLGTAGTGKKDVLEKVGNIICKEKFGLREGLKHEDAEKHICIYDLDNKIKENLGRGYASFMDNNERDRQKDVWKKQMEDILEDLNKKKPQHTFLAIHGVYYRYNNYFSLMDLNLIAKFSPDIIITFIDDIYDISDKITKEEKRNRTNSSCTISEALGWRTVETLIGDIIAGHLFIDPKTSGLGLEEISVLSANIKKLFRKHIPHFVVAVKHPPVMIYKLLFERKKLVFYASFPITSTRTDTKKIQEINEFKKKLNEKYTVFDPASIDEYLIKGMRDLKRGEEKTIKKNKMLVKKNKKWLLLRRLIGDFSRSTDLPDALKLEDLVNIKDAILKHVEKRDFRLIDQCQGVVAYRPFWDGRHEPSGGVDAELGHAIATEKATFVFHPKQDGDPKTMFKGVEDAVKFPSLDELFKQLELAQADNDAIKKDIPDTWERE